MSTQEATMPFHEYLLAMRDSTAICTWIHYWLRSYHLDIDIFVRRMYDFLFELSLMILSCDKSPSFRRYFWYLSEPLKIDYSFPRMQDRAALLSGRKTTSQTTTSAPRYQIRTWNQDPPGSKADGPFIYSKELAAALVTPNSVVICDKYSQALSALRLEEMEV